VALILASTPAKWARSHFASRVVGTLRWKLPLSWTASDATVLPHDLGVSLEELFEVSDK